MVEAHMSSERINARTRDCYRLLLARQAANRHESAFHRLPNFPQVAHGRNRLTELPGASPKNHAGNPQAA
jgi:hypothetical protein